MNDSPQLCVLLVVGGDSPERDVSMQSGMAVYDALRSRGHRVFVTDPLRSDVKPTEDPRPLFDRVKIGQEPPRIDEAIYEARRRFLDVIGHYRNLSCDIVFNALHGGAGEDGTFQAVLEYLGVIYTGSAPTACHVAMDKDLAKRVVAHAGVPVPKQLLIDSLPHEQLVVDEQVLEALSFPVVVKPNDGGSSVGVTIVNNRGELHDAVREAKQHAGAYLIESFIPGREITVAMMDYHDLPILEICPKDGFFDYKNKYQAGKCDYLVPAPLDDAVADRVMESASMVYRSIGLCGYARIDFRLTEDGDHYFLEANTLPGLTRGSLFPKAAKQAGIDYEEMVSTILRLAMAPTGPHA